MGHGLVQRDQSHDLAVLDRQVAAGRGAREGQAFAARAVAQDAVGLERFGRRVDAGGVLDAAMAMVDSSSRAPERSLKGT